MVQCFIWDILPDDRAKIKILDFSLVPGSLNQLLGVFGDTTELGPSKDLIAIKMW